LKQDKKVEEKEKEKKHVKFVNFYNNTVIIL